MKKFAFLSFAIATLVIVVVVSFMGSNTQSFASLLCDKGRGIVDKKPCEAFTVKIEFKNTGTTEGTWSVNVAFEGEAWSWTGTAQVLTLKAGKSKVLIWDGKVPCNALEGSMARLIVYYNDSYVALDWWIHVVSDAKLSITSGTVE